MRAARGAVESVRINNDTIELKVIGEVTPTGICGSVLLMLYRISAVGLIEKSGRLKRSQTLTLMNNKRALTNTFAKQTKKQGF
jgi:hypothetical protein